MKLTDARLCWLVGRSSLRKPRLHQAFECAFKLPGDFTKPLSHRRLRKQFGTGPFDLSFGCCGRRKPTLRRPLLPSEATRRSDPILRVVSRLLPEVDGIPPQSE